MNDPEKQQGGGYVGGAILTVFFFLLVGAIVIAALVGVGFAVIAMPVTTLIVLLFFAVAGLAAWRAKVKHDRAVRRARKAVEGEPG